MILHFGTRSSVQSMTSPQVEILRANRAQERKRWLEIWKSWPAREVYAHPSYVELCAPDRGIAAAAVGRVQGLVVLYPFIIRCLQREPFWDEGCGECVDLVSPYGYAGPYWWGEGDRAQAAGLFWRGFDAWAAESSVVSEFIRFDLHPDRLVPYPGTVEVRLDNVIRSLDLSLEDLWMDVAHKVRKNVNRARRGQLQVEMDGRGQRLEDFLQIYWGTMALRDVESRYLFSREWFRRLVRELPGMFMFFHVLKEHVVVSSELVLVSTDFVYSYLGGTDPAAFPDRPNDLLKFEVMSWAREAGKKAFVLGGGFRPDDGSSAIRNRSHPVALCPSPSVLECWIRHVTKLCVDARRPFVAGLP